MAMGEAVMEANVQSRSTHAPILGEPTPSAKNNQASSTKLLMRPCTNKMRQPAHAPLGESRVSLRLRLCN